MSLLRKLSTYGFASHYTAFVALSLLPLYFYYRSDQAPSEEQLAKKLSSFAPELRTTAKSRQKSMEEFWQSQGPLAQIHRKKEIAKDKRDSSAPPGDAAGTSTTADDVVDTVAVTANTRSTHSRGTVDFDALLRAGTGSMKRSHAVVGALAVEEEKQAQKRLEDDLRLLKEREEEKQKQGGWLRRLFRATSAHSSTPPQSPMSQTEGEASVATSSGGEATPVPERSSSGAGRTSSSAEAQRQ